MVLMLAAHDAHDIPSTRWISLTMAIVFFAKVGKNRVVGVEKMIGEGFAKLSKGFLCELCAYCGGKNIRDVSLFYFRPIKIKN
jgi:hypothetical protein